MVPMLLGVINIITQTDADRANLTAGLGSNRYQEYSGSFQRKVNDNTRVTVAGAFQDSKGYNIQPNSTYSVDSDRDGWGNKSFWAGIEHKFSEQVSGFVRGYGYGASSDYDAGLQEALMNSRSIIIPMTVDSAISKTVLPPRSSPATRNIRHLIISVRKAAMPIVIPRMTWSSVMCNGVIR